MRNVDFFIVNAFTDHPFKGNPAGVVLDADDLPAATMQRIAAELKCSETAFVTPGTAADVNLRFFSPACEVDLCGHATVAAFHAMAATGLVRPGTFTMGTRAGILSIEVGDSFVFMAQTPPQFKDVFLDKDDLAGALGVRPSSIADHPIEAVSTGLFSLNVPIRERAAMQKMRPDPAKVRALCERVDVGSVFPFTFETVLPESFVHCRCFAPRLGVNEDPVTGTANGALGAYLYKHGLVDGPRYRAEQGFELGRDGIVVVEPGETVRIGGAARIVVRGSLELDADAFQVPR
jgi:PhzF family phenazine biosynthesis protein